MRVAALLPASVIVASSLLAGSLPAQKTTPRAITDTELIAREDLFWNGILARQAVARSS